MVRFSQQLYRSGRLLLRDQHLGSGQAIDRETIDVARRLSLHFGRNTVGCEKRPDLIDLKLPLNRRDGNILGSVIRLRRQSRDEIHIALTASCETFPVSGSTLRTQHARLHSTLYGEIADRYLL